VQKESNCPNRSFSRDTENRTISGIKGAPMNLR
jgi:hypothetical protein